MGRIKSALEIALEKTEDIVIDKEEIKRQEELNNARKLIGSYLLGEKDEFESTKEKLLDISPSILREALKLSVVNTLSISESSSSEETLNRLKKLFSAFIKNGDANELLGQLIGFINQYPKHKKQLVEDFKKQAEPILKDHEEKLKKKYGGDIKLNIEDDKELMEALRRQLDQLKKRYEITLDENKKALLDMI